LIDVYAFPTWPLNQDEGVAVCGDRLARAVGDVNSWLWGDDFAGVIVVSPTDVGGSVAVMSARSSAALCSVSVAWERERRR
jgi:hypothetical protein